MFSYFGKAHKTQVVVVAVFFSVVLLIRIVPFVAAVITVIDMLRDPIDSCSLRARASWQLSGSPRLPVYYSPQLCILVAGSLISWDFFLFSMA